MLESPYYVGVGASAGGLEALEDFFKAMPSDTGMIFVVVQHLSPDYKSLMDELLARHTDMPIKIVTDGLETEPNTIYLIPPKNNLLIFHGKLYLEEYKERKGLNLPVDVFFRSLAIDQEKHAIGVILSGTGSDGTLGVRAIKETGGMVMVQDEQTAKFDGMPRSSISTGLVDYILPPTKMAEELLNYIKHPLVSKSSAMDNILSKNIDTLAKIILILRDYCGTDFSYYKENTIIRRLERRVSINRFNTLEEYLELLSESDKEKDTLYRELLIGVTRFFRDQDAFRIIEEKVMPKLNYEKKMIRVWSAGCSTGEEVYSLAMMLLEYIEQNNLDCELKIFATDIDRRALDTAGQGYYPESIVADIEQSLLMKYFNRKENGYQVNEQVRKSIVFASHNLLKDPPFSKLDILVCRNLFIYFKPDVQQKIISMFYYSLNPAGYLFMGSSESIGEMSEAFETVDSKWKIYQIKEGYRSTMVKELPILSLSSYPGAREQRGQTPKSSGIEKIFESTLMKVLPPSVLIDKNDNIIQVINDVSQFITIKPGRFTNNILANLPNELSLYGNNILRQLKAREADVVFKNIVNVKGFENKKVHLKGSTIHVEKNQYYLLSFQLDENIGIEKAHNTDEKGHNDQVVNPETEMSERVSQLERELKTTEENLQATIEELETSNEELQSSNEELISSNEELQSTNEELQSVNEELFTVNSEYQLKIDELNKLNNDMDNLLKNTEVGALYLDRNLCIRKITPIVSKLTNIILSDIGRPISHISFIGSNSELLDDINKVIENLQSIEKEIIDVDGNAWLTKVRPYRTSNNAIEGIMITFIEINRLRDERTHTEYNRKRLEDALEIGRMAWWEWETTTSNVIYDNKMATMIGYAPKEFPCNIHAIYNLIHPDDYEDSVQTMQDLLEGRIPFWEKTYRIRAKQGNYVWYYDRGYVSECDKDGKPLVISGTVFDVTNFKNVEWELKQSRSMFKKVLEQSVVARTIVNELGEITYANQKALDLFAMTNEDMLMSRYDALDWEITDIDNKPIPTNEVPFVVIKKTKQPISGYKHYVKTKENKKILVTVDGVPVLTNDGEVEAIVFTFREQYTEYKGIQLVRGESDG